MTAKPTERDLIEEAEALSGWAILALPPSPHWKGKATFDGARRIDDLLHRLVAEVKALRAHVIDLNHDMEASNQHCEEYHYERPVE